MSMKKCSFALLTVLCLLLCLTLPVGAEEIAVDDAVIAGTVTAEEESAAESSEGVFAMMADAVRSAITAVISGFVETFLNGIAEAVDAWLGSILEHVFHVETFFSKGNVGLLSDSMLDDLYRFLYAAACGLVVLKFLTKGIGIYILGRGGDPESSPRDMLIGAAQAVVVMVGFPFLYEKGVDIFLYFARGIMGQLHLEAVSFGAAVEVLFSFGLLTILLLIVFFVLLLILWIFLMKQGLELLIMRLGVPFATLGLLDSDMALWKNYYQTFLKLGFTVVIQVVLMSLSIRMVLLSGGLLTPDLSMTIGAIACVVTALSAPKLMQQWLVPQGGGGGLIQKAYSTAMVVRAVKMLAA